MSTFSAEEKLAMAPGRLAGTEEVLADVRADRDAAVAELASTKDRLVACEAATAKLRDELDEKSRMASALVRERDELVSTRDGVESTLAMYRHAWTRELGAHLQPKMYAIDGLVASTRAVVAKAEETAALASAIASAVETLGGQPGEDLQHCAERVRHEWERTASLAKQWEVLTSKHSDRANRAERALLRAGFEDHGGEDWAPPHQNPERHTRITAEEFAAMSDAGVAASQPRDEFAKAAMHAIVLACKEDLEDGSLKSSVVAQRAYRIADAMIAVRSKPVDTKASKDAAEQMRAACRDAVLAQLSANGYHEQTIRRVVNAAVDGVKVGA